MRGGSEVDVGKKWWVDVFFEYESMFMFEFECGFDDFGLGLAASVVEDDVGDNACDEDGAIQTSDLAVEHEHACDDRDYDHDGGIPADNCA